MKNIGKLTTRFTKALSCVVALIICLAYLAFLPVGTFAFAETTYTSFEDLEDGIASKNFNVENGQFSSGSFMSDPSSWTGAFTEDYAETSATAIYNGVIDLASDSFSSDNKKSTGLDKYSEFRGNLNPMTPFGTDEYAGTNTKVLLINTDELRTAYGYTSDELKLTANSYYEFSVWVKTGNFAQDQGAVIKLNGFDEPFGIWNINTFNTTNKFGWENYRLLVGIDQTDITSSLSLMVGDHEGSDHNFPSKGYAMFDNITAREISPTVFAELVAKADDHTAIADFSNKGELVRDTEGDVIGGFDGDYRSHWSFIQGAADTAVGTYDSTKSITENAFGMTTDPVSPYGKSNEGNNLFVISATKKAAQIGVQSKDFIAKQNTLYAIGVWVNTQKWNSDTNASLVINGESDFYNNSTEDYSLTEASINIDNNTSKTRYGWKKYYFYLCTSARKDCKIHLELWLGKTAACTGIVMFDDIRIEELDEKEYRLRRENGKEVTFNYNSNDGDIVNSNFNLANAIGTYDRFPVAPTDWTALTVENYDSTQVDSVYSKNAVDTSGFVGGIVPTDKDAYNKNKDKFLYNELPYLSDLHRYLSSGILMMASDKATAYGYRSSAITLTKNSYTEITATLLVNDMTGAGVNLFVRDADSKIILASIQNITDTSDVFKTFSIYVNGVAGKSIECEIWFGRPGEHVAQTATGCVFVSSIVATSSTEDAYNAAKTEIDNSAKMGFNYPAAVYSFDSTDFTIYDHNDTSVFKTPYNWSLPLYCTNADGDNGTSYGIVNTAYLDKTLPDFATLPAEIKNGNVGGADNLLVLYNKNAGASVMQASTGLSFESGIYAKISVTMLVYIPEGAKADTAKVQLMNIGIGDEDIPEDNKDKLVPNNRFIVHSTTDKTGIYNDDGTTTYPYLYKTYNFYIHVGDTSVSTNLRFTLGDTTMDETENMGNEYSYMLISSIDVSTSEDSSFTNLEYDEVVKSIDAGDNEYGTYIDLTNGAEEDKTDKEEPTASTTNFVETWWIIPSVLFGAAIIIAIVGYIINKIVEKRRRKQKKLAAASYDRKYTIGDIEENERQKNANANVDRFDDSPVLDDTEAQLEETESSDVTAEESPADETSSDN